MDEEAKLLSDTFTSCKHVMETMFCSTLPNPKNAEASEDVRKEGNVLFSKKSHSHESHAETLRSYNKSAALAPNGSQELVCAYANRSAFLLHISKYEECIQDIDRALEINKSDELKIKLLCRKVESLKNLGIPSYKNILEEAQSFVSKLDNIKNKKSLEAMVNKVATMSVAEKAKDSNQKSNKTINLPVTDNALEKVSIRYNEKYGRYLVANQNYSPGDIIFVDKIFSTTLKPEFHYINCHHCLKICWTGIPCDHCEWALFCSEDCKLRSWQEYHDMECSLGSFYNMHSIFGIPWYRNPCSDAIEIFIKAIKAAGSVENLKAQLEAVDQCSDICSRGFYKDGEFNSNTLESFYSLLKRKYIAPAISKDMALFLQCTLIVLIGLVKYPLKSMFQVKEAKDMMQNENIVFLGSALLKFTAIHVNNSFSFYHFLSHHEIIAQGIPENARGFCASSLVSLLNNSCCANTEVCFTEDGRVILYALQPIKKHDQIFYSYSRQYYLKHLEDRREDLKKYNFECDCQACTEAWPPVLLDVYEIMKDTTHQDLAEAKLIQQCTGIWVPMEKDNYHETSLKLIAPKIDEAFKTLKQPSIYTCTIQEVLGKCITNTYGGLQPQFYGECKMLNAESKRITRAYYGSGSKD